MGFLKATLGNLNDKRFDALREAFGKEAVNKVIKQEAERIQREAYAARPIRTERWEWSPDFAFPWMKPAPWHVPPEVDANAIEADGFSVTRERRYELPAADQTAE